MYQTTLKPVVSADTTRRSSISPLRQSAATRHILSDHCAECATQAAIHSCHTGMAGGHIGLKKTLYQVSRRFYWTSWKSDVGRYCRRCPECCSCHRGQLPRAAPLQPIVTGAPFEQPSTDLTGPHNRSRQGYIYILTCKIGRAHV
jgi:hypothetical protein